MTSMTKDRPQRIRVRRMSDLWRLAGPNLLPFADAATEELPLRRLLRLSLFQVTVGMALVLLNATLNRVMIVELGFAATLVSAMVAIPILFAPMRLLIGHGSDNHKSFLGWRRVPYVWTGTMLQFGGFAIMPMALLVMTGQGEGPAIYGEIGAVLAFLLLGAGMHTIQTTGLALASDLSPDHARPRVVALLYVMLLLGMVLSSLLLGWLLADFTNTKLVQVVQGAAVVTIVLNVIALWKQEPRDPQLTAHNRQRPNLRQAWKDYAGKGQVGRLMVALALGSAAFSMQDILLEPYGGEVLGLSVGATTQLTALWAVGTLIGFALAGRALARGGDAYRQAALGAVIGLAAFPAVILADPTGSALLFRSGAFLIGLGGGLFSVSTLLAAMALSDGERNGLALGAWGAVQATATGLAIALGGGLRDLIGAIGASGALGPNMEGPAAGYMFVYHIEIALIFATLVALGPLVGRRSEGEVKKFGLAEFPG